MIGCLVLAAAMGFDGPEERFERLQVQWTDNGLQTWETTDAEIELWAECLTSAVEVERPKRSRSHWVGLAPRAPTAGRLVRIDSDAGTHLLEIHGDWVQEASRPRRWWHAPCAQALHADARAASRTD